jgi:hypothetical protein
VLKLKKMNNIVPKIIAEKPKLSRVAISICLAIVFLFSARLVSSAYAFRFVSWGDTKTGTSALATLSNQAKALSPTFTIYTGDLIDSGSGSGTLDTWKNALNGGSNNGTFDITFPVRGNHDKGTSALWPNFFDLAGVAARIGATNYTELNPDATYSFDYGNSHFVGIDVLGDVTAMSAAQIIWLDNDLTAAEDRGLTHAFLFWHGPIYAVDDHCCPTAPSNLITVLNKHSIVSATFHGHEHVIAYAHIDSSRISGVTHPFEEFVTGAGGAGRYSCRSGRSEYCYSSDDSFATIDVSGTSFTANFYRKNNTTPLQTWTFTKGGTSPPTVDIKANDSDGPITIPSGTSATLSWTSTDATSCTASGGWSGGKATSGSESTGNLTASKTYTLTCNGPGGSGSDSVTVNVSTDTQKPTVPTNLQATAVSGTKVDLTWTASTDNVGVTGYKIYRNGGAAPIGTSTTTSYSDTTVSPSTAYTYEVSAYDAATNESDKSSPASVTTPCSALPTDKGVATVSVSPGAGTYRIWSRVMAPDSDKNSYYLQVDGDCGTVVGDSAIPANTWTWVDYKDGSTSSKITMDLTSDDHDIKMIGREAGVKIDRIIFTENLTCTPTGFGGNCLDVSDSIPPTVSVTQPAGGQTVSGTVNITASATDNVGVTRVEFLIDGGMVGNDTSSPYSYSWDTTTVSNGSHNLRAKAYDAAGNSGVSAPVNVIVGNSPDTDGDGFTDAIENYIGTDPNLACGPSAWPPDFDDNQTVNLLDVLEFKPHYGSSVQNPDPNGDGIIDYDPRYDLNADGSIDLLDLLPLKPSFKTSCAP